MAKRYWTKPARAVCSAHPGSMIFCTYIFHRFHKAWLISTLKASHLQMFTSRIHLYLIIVFINVKEHKEHISGIQFQENFQRVMQGIVGTLILTPFASTDLYCGECRERSDCTYVQSDLALHSALVIQSVDETLSMFTNQFKCVRVITISF